MANIKSAGGLTQKSAKVEVGLVVNAAVNSSTTVVSNIVESINENTVVKNSEQVSNEIASAAGLKAVRKSISLLEFRKLFTLAERIKFDNVEFSDSTPKEVKAAMATIFRDLAAAPKIEMGTAGVTRGVLFMLKHKFITEKRAAEVLACIPQDS